MTIWAFHTDNYQSAPSGRSGQSVFAPCDTGKDLFQPAMVLETLALAILMTATAMTASGQGATYGQGGQTQTQRPNLPPRVVQAQRFLAQRGLTHGRAAAAPIRRQMSPARPESQTPETAAWQSIGPSAVQSPNFGLITGRVSSIALDPSDSTGNRLYLGTTGGGVWVAQNAGSSNPSNITFTPLTDNLAALSGVPDASISIGALTVQPGGTGVILAGTGDPNDALDSYYGAGILRSADNGNSWSLIPTTQDKQLSFIGEGFAGFAWSTVNPQLVVAAVSQAYEGKLVGAPWPHASYQGLYYSPDSGVTWRLARITDGIGANVQGPIDPFANPDGNAATSVVWNKLRGIFVAAVRFHGYYQSSDGITFTRMTAQPGSGLTTLLCPTNPGYTGSPACPIFRGTLAVNPLSGDTFAWTVDANNQDLGIWQDQCAVSAGNCTNQQISFGTQWSTAKLETDTIQGRATILNGDYNLALAAVPSGQDTLLIAGANDLWKCSLAMGCTWRNATNANTCMSAQVAAYQHALEWNGANPLEIFIGNDSGIWRSMDAIGETDQACASTDASHFQSLNGSLGSLAEVVSMAQPAATPYTVMIGLGVNGTAGVKSSSITTGAWPEILGGEGGPVAINPNLSNAWYVNNQAGVSIHACTQLAACTSGAFGSSPVIDDADVGGDGLRMTTPAPFLVDPLDQTNLLVGTCRVWRGPADGSNWSAGNAISPILNGGTGNLSCKGDALIRSMASLALPGGTEVVYVGMYGPADGGSVLAGHVFTAIFDPAASAMPIWQDLTLNPVTNDNIGMNVSRLDNSSIFIDSHDTTGKTVYVTFEGMVSPAHEAQIVYRSTDGGNHWLFLTANLPGAQANSLVVDPQDSNTVYVATDVGVYSTRQIASCASSNCWSIYGSGLPKAPVVQISAAPSSGTVHVLTAATYGRGVWQIPLWTAGQNLTVATMTPNSLTFQSQTYGSASSAQSVEVKNTGAAALMLTAIDSTGDFSETDNCLNAVVIAGASCTIQVSFTPSSTGSRLGKLTISGNVALGALTLPLSGTATPSGAVRLSPASIAFGQEAVGTTSAQQPVSAGNSSGSAVPVTNVVVTPPFNLASNSCGISLAAGSACQLMVTFEPTQTGAASGTLTMIDADGTQTVQLSGTGAAAPTDTLSATALTFPGTVTGQLSAPQTVVMTNSGDLAVTSIADSVTGAFQSSSTCGTTMPGHTSCVFSVVFAPSQAVAQTGVLTVTDSLHVQTVALSGSGLVPPAFGVSSSTMTFSSQKVGQASPPLTLTVNNTGGAPMANVGFQITGQTAASFSVTATTCGTVLNAGSSCTVQVTFTPSTTGGSAATLLISSSTIGVAPITVALSGMGTAAGALSVNPPQLTFPIVTPGQSSVAQPVTVTNTGAVSLTSLSLSAPLPFSLVQNTCTGTLAAGVACTAGVVFTPQVNGAFNGLLTISSPALATAANVLLSGVGGVPGSVQVQPALLNFPQTGVGATSSPIAVTVTNPSGTTALGNFKVAVSAGFLLVNNTCPSALAAQASCSAGVEFAPGSAGSQTGNLILSNSASTDGQLVPLQGMGFDFTAMPSGSSSQTVANGQSASYKLIITPLNGSQGTFTFKCGSLPAYTQCIFNPTSAGISANMTGFEVVQISTGQSQTSARSAGAVGWRALPVLWGLLLLPLGWKRRGRALLLVALLAILAGGMSSCASAGGGSGGVPPRSGPGFTAPGTYSILINVLSSGVTHGVTLTLTVD